MTRKRERTSAIHTIHQSEKSGDDRSMDLILLATSDGSEACRQDKARNVISSRLRTTEERAKRLTIDLIEEDDTRLTRPRLFEQQPQLPLRFSNPLAQTIRSLSHEESCRTNPWRNCISYRPVFHKIEQELQKIERERTNRSWCLRWSNWQRGLERQASFLFRAGRGRGRLEEE
jgi:hypothetical protein